MQYFWAAALSLSLLLYVVLDGFDLGVGILFPFARNEAARMRMMDAISPVWDGNETWLVISGATLFAAFPEAYAILLSAFYLPLIAMLCGLILRGVAFEFHHKAGRFRWVWSGSFFIGSLVASFVQGCAIGAFVQQLPVHDGDFAGSVFTWLSPYSVLCGVGLCLGYAMLGAGWLVHKTEEDIRAFGYRALPVVMAGVVLFLIVAGISAFVLGLQITHRWIERPGLLAFPAIGAVALFAMYHGIRHRRDRIPYLAGVTMFLAAFATMVLAVLPYIVPFSVTIADAAAPHSSLAFLFWGAGVIVLPITLVYTCVVYFVFRGKVLTSD